MATLQSGKCFTVPTFFGMCCRSEWQERMYIYKWHEVDQTKHEIFCVHIVCNEIQVKVNLEITTFFFYLRFPYCPNFFWFGVVQFSSLKHLLDQWQASSETSRFHNNNQGSTIRTAQWPGASAQDSRRICHLPDRATAALSRKFIIWMCL